MKMFSLALFVLGLSLGAFLTQVKTTSTQAQRTPAEAGSSEADKEFLSQLDAVQVLMSPPQKDALTTYLKLVSRINGRASDSIEQEFLQNTSKPCFRELATQFYMQRFKKDAENLSAHFSGRFTQQLPEVIALNEVAGKGQWSTEPIAGVWHEALNIAKGDSHLALMLVGVCGHDDQVQSRPSIPPTDPSYRSLITLKRTHLEDLRQKTLAVLRETTDAGRKRRLASFLESLTQRKSESQLAELHCLPTSALFVPKALGENLDIDEQLKQRIAKVQSPNLGSSALPAKYYHFIGSAITACAFKSKNWIGNIAVLTNPLLVRGYRSLRMKELSDKLTMKREYDGNKLVKETPKNFPFMNTFKPEELTLPFVQNLINKRMQLPMSGMSDEEYAFYQTPEGELLEQGFRMTEDLSAIGAKAVRERLLAKWATIDALALMKKWYKTQNIKGLGELLLPNETRRAQYHVFNRVSQYGDLASPFALSGNEYECDEPSWSTQRCHQAIDMLNSWEIDFEWTEQAHLRGAIFGAKSCRSLAVNETLEDLACRALGRSPPETRESKTPEITR